MIVYQKTKSEFLIDVQRDSLAVEIEKEVIQKLGKYTSKSEFDSWRNSSITGICWKWVSKSNPVAFDIELPEYDFRIRWNDFNLGQGWILHDESIEQAGCIHTSQGLEVPYVGVILGPDIRYENGRVITDIHQHPGDDGAVRGYKKRMRESPEATAELVDSIIRNTYRTLMTRGMKGCYVFAVDKPLNEYLRRVSNL